MQEILKRSNLENKNFWYSFVEWSLFKIFGHDMTCLFFYNFGTYSLMCLKLWRRFSGGQSVLWWTRTKKINVSESAIFVVYICLDYFVVGIGTIWAGSIQLHTFLECSMRTSASWRWNIVLHISIQLTSSCALPLWNVSSAVHWKMCMFVSTQHISVL